MINSDWGWWWPRLAETTAGDGMLMLPAAGLVHVTASVRIVCKKMSNKRKQTALDLDQKIAIINEIEGGKNRQHWLRSAKLIYVGPG